MLLLMMVAGSVLLLLLLFLVLAFARRQDLALIHRSAEPFPVV